MQPEQAGEGGFFSAGCAGNKSVDEAVNSSKIFGGPGNPPGVFHAGSARSPGRPGEANQGLGSAQDQIAEHGEAGGYAAGGGVGEQGM